MMRRNPKPPYPSLKDLYDCWFEITSNWNYDGSIDIVDYLENSVTLLREEMEKGSVREFVFEDKSGEIVKLKWTEKITETQADSIINGGELWYDFPEHVEDLADEFRKYLRQVNPKYKIKRAREC